jgi:hypothetical protein
MIPDIGKCKKGHSYRVDMNRTETKDLGDSVLFKRKWTCRICGRHMEDKSI